MLDGLLGRGFSSKCKSLIKLTRTRLDVIKRKRNAMQKYLKKDIADLLANGLDINAYGRAEGLSVELNLSSCYDFVEQFCEFVPKHLSAMQKQRECPEECKEAVSSLMFAAARFADLPELRDLRDMFTERYGKTLESFANMEFVENLASKPPTTEKKLQLMRAIAQEFSIKWDSKAFEQKIANSPLPAQDRTKRQGSTKDGRTDGNKQYNSRDELAPQRDNQDVPSRGRHSDNGYMLHGNREEHALDRGSLKVPPNGRPMINNDGYRLHKEEGLTIPKKDDQDVLSHRKLEVSDNRYKQHKGREETILQKDLEYHDGFRPKKVGDHTAWKREKHDPLPPQEYAGDGFKQYKGRDDDILKRNNLENSYHVGRKQDSGHGRVDTVGQRDDDILKRNNLENSYHVGRKQDNGHGRVDTVGRDDDDILKRNNLENSYHGRRKQDNGHGRVKTVARRDKQEVLSYEEQDHPTVQQKMKVDPKEELPFVGEKANTAAEGTRLLPPPPYVKPNGGKYTTRYAASDKANNKSPADCQDNDRSERTQTELDCDDRRVGGPARVYDPKNVDHQDDLIGDKMPKPKSVRRRRLKPQAGQEDRDKHEGDETVKRHPNGRRREDMRQGLQHALEDDRRVKDEDERMMDKLLAHYSKKPSKFEPIKVKEGLNAPAGHHDDSDIVEPQRRQRRDKEPVPPPSRAASLPPEPVTPTEPNRVPARATSFQPEMLNPGPHVHPRLPNYDDLATRFAALRGR